MKLAEKIQMLRKRKGMSQEQLAEALDVSRQAVSKWESDQSMPEIEKVVQLSELFHISTDALLIEDMDVDANPVEELDKRYTSKSIDLIALVARGFMIIGLIIGLALWSQWQTILSATIGLLVNWFGAALVELGSAAMLTRDASRAFRRKFYQKSIWLLLPIPVCVLAHGAFQLVQRPYTSGLVCGAAIVIYLILGFSICLLLRGKRADRAE